MESLRHENSILYQILEQSHIKLLCPLCLKGFPRTDSLYRHFRVTNDDIHPGLDPMADDFKRFHFCYQQAMKTSIPSKQLSTLSQGGKCFEAPYIIRHYGKSSQSMAATETSHQGLNTSKLPVYCFLALIFNIFMSQLPCRIISLVTTSPSRSENIMPRHTRIPSRNQRVYIDSLPQAGLPIHDVSQLALQAIQTEQRWYGYAICSVLRCSSFEYPVPQ